MTRIKILLYCLVLSIEPMACKRKNQTPVLSGAHQEVGDLQGKPDKVSEEPTGLPGYPLACRWVQSPANDTLNAAVDCYLSDAGGQPARLPTAPTWKVAYPGAAATVDSIVSPDQSVRVNVKAKTRNDIALAMQDLQVRVNWNGVEKVRAGREVLKAEANQWRVAASCQTLFTFLTVDSTSSFAFSESNRFDGCELLTSRLMNAVIPNASYRQLKDTHKTVGATCSGGMLTVTVNQLAGQQSWSQGPLDTQACLDLSALINSLGL